MGAKPIQLILARQLASCVAIPVMLFDAEGTLVFYNEPAEAILGQRFDETGEVAADDFLQLVQATDDAGHPLPVEERPTRVAWLERRPVSRVIRARGTHTEWRRLQVTAVPLAAEGDQLVGVVHFFWEAEP